MRMWVMRRSSRSWPASSPIPNAGEWLQFPLTSTMGLHPPWPAPNQGGSCPTGDQALDRRQADTAREVNQLTLPEVQKSHSIRPQSPIALSSQGWAFLPNINNRLLLLKNEIQNKAHQYTVIQKAQRGFQFCCLQPSTVPLFRITSSSHLHPWH